MAIKPNKDNPVPVPPNIYDSILKAPVDQDAYTISTRCPLSSVWKEWVKWCVEFGIEANAIIAVPYDWRLPPSMLEERDLYFHKLKLTFEIALKLRGGPSLVFAHSMGNNVFRYFLEWLKLEIAPKHYIQWLDEHIHAYFAVGAPLLGSIEAIRAALSGSTFGLPVSEMTILLCYPVDLLMYNVALEVSDGTLFKTIEDYDPQSKALLYQLEKSGNSVSGKPNNISGDGTVSYNSLSWCKNWLGPKVNITRAPQEGYKVKLNVYDLSNGLARQLSTSFLGKPIEAIWHTGVVVYGNEYYFGGGIQSSPVGTTPYGRPLRTVELGVTHIPREVFEDYLRDIAPRYTAETYRLLTHNCNNFSNEVAQFLVGVGIPEYILNLPSEVMSSPMGPLIMPMIQNLEATLRNNTAPETTQFVPTAASVSTPPPPQKKAAAPSPAPAATTNAKREAPAPAAAEKPAKETKSTAAADPLGNARGKVQEEVMKEFAAIMANGTLRASEAAALAMRRVMERHGDGATMQQS
ncbi:hypothetical protein PR202_ga03264 [Eleusine coracana subsp. coracana]|uniref:PPPDE domain-containing protein n=1 Tax=Eleusine coracana subsp. coracana TaxID=191504 RepID=A0AAV5BNU3_ELECO|nr:hypothetical protein PR202_ga03264 [Eleusine coracana subsp. coracana]